MTTTLTSLQKAGDYEIKEAKLHGNGQRKKDGENI